MTRWQQRADSPPEMSRYVVRRQIRFPESANSSERTNLSPREPTQCRRGGPFARRVSGRLPFYPFFKRKISPEAGAPAPRGGKANARSMGKLCDGRRGRAARHAAAGRHRRKIRQTVNAGLALCVLLIGLSGALETQKRADRHPFGRPWVDSRRALRVERGIDRLGECAQRRFSRGDSGFATGFVNATLLFAVGSMAVVGSLGSGALQQAGHAAGQGGAGRRFGGHIRVVVRRRRGVFGNSADALSGRHRAAFRRAGPASDRRADRRDLRRGAQSSSWRWAEYARVTKERIRVGNMLRPYSCPASTSPSPTGLRLYFEQRRRFKP